MKTNQIYSFLIMRLQIEHSETLSNMHSQQYGQQQPQIGEKKQKPIKLRKRVPSEPWFFTIGVILTLQK